MISGRMNSRDQQSRTPAAPGAATVIDHGEENQHRQRADAGQRAVEHGAQAQGQQQRPSPTGMIDIAQQQPQRQRHQAHQQGIAAHLQAEQDAEAQARIDQGAQQRCRMPAQPPQCPVEKGAPQHEAQRREGPQRGGISPGDHAPRAQAEVIERRPVVRRPLENLRGRAERLPDRPDFVAVHRHPGHTSESAGGDDQQQQGDETPELGGFSDHGRHYNTL